MTLKELQQAVLITNRLWTCPEQRDRIIKALIRRALKEST